MISCFLVLFLWMFYDVFLKFVFWFGVGMNFGDLNFGC